MEYRNANRLVITAQAASKTPIAIDLIPAEGYDGQAAHDEAQEIFDAMYNGLCGYTYTRIMQLMLVAAAEAEDGAGEDLLAQVYRNAYSAACGDKHSATADLQTLEAFYDQASR